MFRTTLLLTVLVLGLAATLAQAESTDFLPAGMLLTCTMDEPNFSSKTAEVGDPVLCHVSSTAAFGHQVFPRGAYLSGRLQDAKDPGHLYGKGWLEVSFDRLVLPGEAVLPLTTKIVGIPHYKIEKDGRIDGKGHVKRDIVEWSIPVLWPIKVLTIPGRGPYPTLKGEQRITLRLMEDTIIPLTSASTHYVPKPPWAQPSSAPVSGTPWYNNGARVTPNPDRGYRLMNAGATYGRQSPPESATPVTQTAKTSTHDGQATLIRLNNQGTVFAKSYSVSGDRVLCVLEDGQRKVIPIASVDFVETVRVNQQGDTPVTLASTTSSGGMQ